MGASTELVGPYDGLTTSEKIRVMCGIPLDVSKEVFHDKITLRGAQDKILARMFYIFYCEFNSERNKQLWDDCITVRDKETLINNILNKLGKLQIENQDSDGK